MLLPKPLVTILAIGMLAALIGCYSGSHPARIGSIAPDFTLQDSDHTVTLSQFRGQVVLLNFWATWCAPCQVEMPWLADLGRQYRSRGLEIIGLSVDEDDRNAVARFVSERHIDYPILLKDRAVADAYGGVRYLPQTFLIGRDGRIISRAFGLRTRGDFEADIQRALRASVSEKP